MIGRVLRRNPVTLAIIAILLGTAAIGGGFRGPGIAIRFALGTGYEQVVENGRWWTPLASVFLTDGGIHLAIVALAAAVLVGVSEQIMGSWRTAVAFVTTAVVGASVGIVAQTAANAAGELWARRVSELVTADPMTAIAGTLMTASAFVGVLWRRRIRVLTLSSVVVFLLYSGQPSDFYRFVGALAGLGLGYALSSPDGRRRWHRSSHHETRVLLSAVVTISALGPVVTLLSQMRLGPLAPLGLLLADARPASLRVLDRCQALQVTRTCLHDIDLERISGVGPVLLTLLPLLTLLVAAFALLRGRRFGAWLAVVVNVALAALAAFFYGLLPLFGQSLQVKVSTPRYWEVTLDLVICTLLPLIIAIVVLANLEHFTVHVSRRAVRLYLAGVVVALVGLGTVYVGFGWLLRDGFSPNVTLLDLLSDLPDRFVPVGFLKIEPLTFAPVQTLTSILYYWIGPAFWILVVAGALLVTLRPTRGSSASGRARVGKLLRAGGGGSLAYWATWAGNSYWFSSDGRAAVAYRVINGVAVTTSEPIGDDEASLAAIVEFARHCDDNGWTPVFYAIHGTYADACERMGWSSTIIGDETVVHPSEWDTTGKRWQDIRSSINRAEREGVRAEWTSFGQLSARHLSQIVEISEQWVAEKDLPEMGFTLGSFDELRDPAVRLMIARDARDHVVAITSWLPSYRGGEVIGWTLDFMRRTPDGSNGVMEFLIARSAERFRDDGVEFMSLSTAPLARGGEDDAEAVSGAARVLEYIGTRLEPVYGFRSLLNFKRKFQPEFRPLAMAYPDALALPAIGVALARAYLPSMSVRGSIQFLRNIGQRD
ncbi:MAG: Lysyl-tRNA synthetase [Microbacteriaceae bacterium]|nr:Lysyl-tRNA synthetase [Microbacteriaceae bacterium]